jgi:hypothetical protein
MVAERFRTIGAPASELLTSLNLADQRRSDLEHAGMDRQQTRTSFGLDGRAQRLFRCVKQRPDHVPSIAAIL